MKRKITVALFITTLCCRVFALDHIILRNGQEYDVKLHQVTDDNIIYSINGDKEIARESVPTKEVYMVNIEKQGNVYLTHDGKRVTGESKRVDPKKYDVIYLVAGAEIGVKGLLMTEDTIKFRPIQNGGLLTNILGSVRDSGEQSLPNSDVFMIRYKSGMVDIITPVEHKEKPLEDTAEESQQSPKYVVVFHAVGKGENLNGIAEKYNVSVSQIIEWNDLPVKSKANVPLKTGMQLMIYQPKQN